MYVLEKGYIKKVEKLWGEERWIVNNEKYCGKILYLNQGAMCSLHHHPVKDETFHVLHGWCFLEIEEKILKLDEHDSVRIYPNTQHRFWTGNPTGCIIVEVSTPHDDNDVVRARDSVKL